MYNNVDIGGGFKWVEPRSYKSVCIIHFADSICLCSEFASPYIGVFYV